jgi:hypothetical protein
MERGLDDGVSVILRCGEREFKVSRNSALISVYISGVLMGERSDVDVVIDVESDCLGGATVEILGYMVEYLNRMCGVAGWVIPSPLRSLDWDVVFSDSEMGGFGDMKEVLGDFKVDNMDTEDEVKKKRERYDALVKNWRHPWGGVGCDYGKYRKLVREYLDLVGEDNVVKWRNLAMLANYFDIKCLLVGIGPPIGLKR